ncbi:MAG: hypothetical protein ACJAT7_000022 [Psychromonas sp.]|jgi:hypothetical protein|uniref:(Na+)-NQR maturation NqrM n=1 Tax=Psychromonas sp. TaxID=1884585 RepID=UPI0039E6F662
MEFIITFFVFVVVIIAMAVGVIFGRKGLQGSCGGLASVGIDKSCDCETVCSEHQRLYQIQEPEK